MHTSKGKGARGIYPLCYYYFCVLVTAFGCGVVPPARQATPPATVQHSANTQQTSESPRTDSMPTGIFDGDQGGTEAWQRFTEDGRYRVARAADFKIPEVAMQENGYDIGNAIKFAYVGEDINHDGLYRDRALIIIDTTRNDAKRLGLVIFNELKDKTTLPKPYWLYRERDLSRAVMFWSSGGLGIREYDEDGTYHLCRVRWNQLQQKYYCD